VSLDDEERQRSAWSRASHHGPRTRSYRHAGTPSSRELTALAPTTKAPGDAASVGRFVPPVVAAAYLITVLVAVLRADEGSSLLDSPTVAVLAVVHVATGVLAARWWALALPIVATALAAPFAEPDSPAGAETPIWIGMAFWAPIAVGLVLVGLLSRRIVGAAVART